MNSSKCNQIIYVWLYSHYKYDRGGALLDNELMHSFNIKSKQSNLHVAYTPELSVSKVSVCILNLNTSDI